MEQRNTRRGFTQEIQRRSGVSLTLHQATEQAVRFTHDLHKQPHGFTLIELLVVVLIIGILVAVAVPQYQKAVIKSRAMQMISLVRSLSMAQEVYYLTHGQYADSFEKLDVSLPEKTEQACASLYAGDCTVLKNGCEINLTGDVYKGGVETYLPGSGFKITSYWLNSDDDIDRIDLYGNITCIVFPGLNEQGKQICSSLGKPTPNERYFKL